MSPRRIHHGELFPDDIGFRIELDAAHAVILSESLAICRGGDCRYAHRCATGYHWHRHRPAARPAPWIPPQEFFATCPKGIESLLAEELRALGAESVRETRAGVAFCRQPATGYRACLWSRLASRVLLPLARFPAPTPEALYAGVQTIAWQEHVAPEGTLAVDCATVQSAVNHSYYAALKTKDAIVDRCASASACVRRWIPAGPTCG